MEPLNLSVFDHFPVLETPRLILRQFEARDVEEIYRWRSNPLIGKYISRPPYSSIEESEALIAKVLEGYKNKQSIGWVATLKRDPSILIGACGFNRLEIPNLRAEIGGEMHPDFWGKRFALESTKAIVDFGMDVMHLHSLEARTSPLNKSSIALLEHLGFVKEAHLHECVFKDGQFLDTAIYSKINRSL